MYACMLAVSETISEVLCTQSELSHMASTQRGFYSWLRVHRKAKKVIVMPPKAAAGASQLLVLAKAASFSNPRFSLVAVCRSAKWKLVGVLGKAELPSQESQMSQTSTYFEVASFASICFSLLLASSRSLFPSWCFPRYVATFDMALAGCRLPSLFTVLTSFARLVTDVEHTFWPRFKSCLPLLGNQKRSH